VQNFLRRTKSVAVGVPETRKKRGSIIDWKIEDNLRRTCEGPLGKEILSDGEEFLKKDDDEASCQSRT
jgi:hypothetical protein